MRYRYGLSVLTVAVRAILYGGEWAAADAYNQVKWAEVQTKRGL